MFKERSISNRILEAVNRFRIVVISGARQVGKTTLLKHLFPEWGFVTPPASSQCNTGYWLAGSSFLRVKTGSF